MGVSVLQRRFICVTDGVFRVENALQESQLSPPMMMIVGAMKEETLPVLEIEPGPSLYEADVYPIAPFRLAEAV